MSSKIDDKMEPIGQVSGQVTNLVSDVGNIEARFTEHDARIDALMHLKPGWKKALESFKAKPAWEGAPNSAPPASNPPSVSNVAKEDLQKFVEAQSADLGISCEFNMPGRSTS